MKSAADNAASRITVELIKGMLNATRREMEALIARTAMSPFIREKKDFFTAILNPAGELVVSTSLTLAGNLVDAILQQYPADTMQDGDLFWYNDPYATGGAVSHLPDMVFVMPVFAENRLLAFIECWGHCGISAELFPVLSARPRVLFPGGCYDPACKGSSWWRPKRGSGADFHP